MSLFNKLLMVGWAIMIIVNSGFDFHELITRGWCTRLFKSFLRNNFSILCLLLVFYQHLPDQYPLYATLVLIFWQFYLDGHERAFNKQEELNQ